MANGPIDFLPPEFVPPVVEVGLFGAMSPNKRLQCGDLRGRGGAELEVIIPAYICLVLSSCRRRRRLLSSLFIAIMDSSETGLYYSFLLTELIVSRWVLSACAISHQPSLQATENQKEKENMYFK